MANVQGARAARRVTAPSHSMTSRRPSPTVPTRPAPTRTQSNVARLQDEAVGQRLELDGAARAGSTLFVRGVSANGQRSNPAATRKTARGCARKGGGPSGPRSPSHREAASRRCESRAPRRRAVGRAIGVDGEVDDAGPRPPRQVEQRGTAGEPIGTGCRRASRRGANPDERAGDAQLGCTILVTAFVLPEPLMEHERETRRGPDRMASVAVDEIRGNVAGPERRAAQIAARAGRRVRKRASRRTGRRRSRDRACNGSWSAS